MPRHVCFHLTCSGRRPKPSREGRCPQRPTSFLRDAGTRNDRVCFSLPLRRVRPKPLERACRRKDQGRWGQRASRVHHGRDAVPSVPLFFFATRELGMIGFAFLCLCAVSAPTARTSMPPKRSGTLGTTSLPGFYSVCGFVGADFCSSTRLTQLAGLRFWASQ